MNNLIWCGWQPPLWPQSHLFVLHAQYQTKKNTISRWTQHFAFLFHQKWSTTSNYNAKYWNQILLKKSQPNSQKKKPKSFPYLLHQKLQPKSPLLGLIVFENFGNLKGQRKGFLKDPNLELVPLSHLLNPISLTTIAISSNPNHAALAPWLVPLMSRMRPPTTTLVGPTQLHII